MIKYDEIWLQDFGCGETTWCQDQINNDDERYIRATIADQRIAALEAELAETQAAHAKSHEEAAAWRRQYAELLTELAPWRQMARQLEALREAGMELFLLVDGPNIERLHECGDMPTAVAAAYEQVKGVGGPKIVKLIKLTERGKWHINERGFPVCGSSLELDPIDEMEIERRILHEHAGVCVVCKREFKGAGDE